MTIKGGEDGGKRTLRRKEDAAGEIASGIEELGVSRRRRSTMDARTTFPYGTVHV